ncbi:MAG: integral rane sensor signal transduction histidine kinase [Segetibacter sp.]|jgi:signal transduction histidine kinase|nr:integral rane sensor signal transduction histidine kinase [Segetibacter sp.]
MNQIIEFFKGLIDTNHWPARWHCGRWTDFHGWLYIVSDLMVWLAYFLIPLIILKYLAQKRTGIKFHKVYFLFAAFILLCGSTHFLDALMFWVPAYRLNALVRFVTGVVSLFTVFHLMQILPVLFIQKTNIELEREITRREEVERMLAEANRNLEAFASVASHDLQEPLRKIGMYSDMLYTNNENNLDTKSKQMVEKIIGSTKRLRTMIEDVLTLSTIKSEVELVTVDVNVPVARAIADLEIKKIEKNAVINVGELPKVKGNEAYLTHLFMNLISNAIKFAERKPVINITGKQKDGKAYISIADNGIGMNQSDLERIFTAFQRLHSKTHFEGSGIGLAISKRIVDLHGGNITVESEVGVGSNFTIELQAAD